MCFSITQIQKKSMISSDLQMEIEQEKRKSSIVRLVCWRGSLCLRRLCKSTLSDLPGYETSTPDGTGSLPLRFNRLEKNGQTVSYVIPRQDSSSEVFLIHGRFNINSTVEAKLSYLVNLRDHAYLLNKRIRLRS